ncbi:MAG: hypothetical protein WCL07_01735 [bacterium]
MNTFYALLGNTPDLSRAELAAVTGNNVTSILPTLAKVTTTHEAVELGNVLGGTLKLIQELSTTSDTNLYSDLSKLICGSTHKNIAISNLSALEIDPYDLRALKDEVVKTRPMRFLSLETKDHSLVALRKQHVGEYVIFSNEGQLTIGQTVWIHDADDWAIRDRSKPYRDIKRGMLPPKVARIMANLACVGQTGLSLADPFCGTGTVLAEAALIGCNTVFGSDTNPDAISGTEQNLAWLKQNYALPDLNFSTTLLDATHLDQQLQLVDAIATEPYMGPLMDADRMPDSTKLKNIAKGLTKLYIGALRSWHKILTGKGRVVISIPSFILGNRTILTLTVDDYAELGYNYVSSVPYGKPGATVIRNITILQKN